MIAPSNSLIFVLMLFARNSMMFSGITTPSLYSLFFIIAIILLLLNRFFNPGKLFFIQERMGLDCEGFFAFKFRSMTHSEEIIRKHDDPIETNRITPLGGILRKMRIDELPQILNVLKVI